MNLILTIVNKKSSHLIYVLISLNKERKSKASDENHFHLFKNIDNTDDLLNSKNKHIRLTPHKLQELREEFVRFLLDHFD